MKKSFALTFGFLLVFYTAPQLLAQKKGKGEGQPSSQTTTLSPEVARLYQVYRRAIQFEDFPVARMALMNLMQHFPDKPAYEDSLVYLYVSSGMPAQAVVLGRQRLEKTPENTLLTEMVALAEESTGLLKDALDRYEQLEKKNSNALRLYKIASLQYRLKRFGECQATVNKLMSNPSADTLTMNILYNDGGSQNVKVKAAALNVLGMAAYELGQLDDAEALFQAALQMDKDFLQPKINLNALTQEKEAKAAQGGSKSKEEKPSASRAESTPPKSGTSGKK